MPYSIVKCPYCKTKNSVNINELLDNKPFIDCQGCLEVFKVELVLKSKPVLNGLQHENMGA